MKFKGPVFKSWKDSRGPQPRQVYVYQGQSKNKQMRNMRAMLREIIDSKDPDIITVGDKVIRLCLDEPDPEYSALHLFCAGLTMSKETGESWVACMDVIVQKFVERQVLSEELNIEDKLTGQLDYSNATSELNNPRARVRDYLAVFFRRKPRGVTKA